MSSEPRTARDALIAEVLQGVLQLQDRVAALPAQLNDSLNPTADRMDRAAASIRAATDQLVQAGNKHQASISEYVDQVAVGKIQLATEQAERHINTTSSPTPVETPTVQPTPRQKPAKTNSTVFWIIASALVAFIAGFLAGRLS